METRGAGIVAQGELIDLLRTHGAGALPTTHARCGAISQPRNPCSTPPVPPGGYLKIVQMDGTVSFASRIRGAKLWLLLKFQ
jgi:hypothetical protein